VAVVQLQRWAAALRERRDEARHSRRPLHDRYLNTNDRTFELPFNAVPGDQASYSNTRVTTSGGTASENFLGRNNQFGVGHEYLNSAYTLRRDGALRGAPIVQEVGEFLRDAYHPQGSPVAAYVSSYFKRSTTTNSSFIDPRLSIAYTIPGGNDVVRAAVGATTTEPTANLIDQGFTSSNLVTAGGGGGVTCGGLNDVGSAPSSILRPECGVDEEFALGVSGAINLGQLRSRGFTISGRQHVDPQTYVDYDYVTTSTVLVSAPDAIFAEQSHGGSRRADSVPADPHTVLRGRPSVRTAVRRALYAARNLR